MDNSSIPTGLCQCGCGEKTKNAEQTRAARGWIKGQPKRYVVGHFNQLRRQQSIERSQSGVKVCSQCGESKPLTEYHSDKSQPRGVAGACKLCRCAETKDYRVRNPEKVLEYGKRYREANRDLLNERARLYAQRNPEKRAATFKAYYVRNRAAMAKRYREYVLANREKIRVRDRRRRAKARGAEGRHTFDEVWQMYEDQKGLCAYCESPLFGDFHVDHMQPLCCGGADSWDNLAIACATCNLRKGRRTAEEFWTYLTLQRSY